MLATAKIAARTPVTIVSKPIDGTHHLDGRIHAAAAERLKPCQKHLHAPNLTHLYPENKMGGG
jgi:hypothetical protein